MELKDKSTIKSRINLTETKNNNNLILIVLTSLLILWLTTITISQIVVNIWWFQEVDYLNVFLTQSFGKLSLGLLTFFVSFSFLWINLEKAGKYSHQQSLFILPDKQKKLDPQSPQLTLNILLLITLLFCILISLNLFFYTQFFSRTLDPSIQLPNFREPSSLPLQLGILKEIFKSFSAQIWQLILIAILTISTILRTKETLRIVTIYFSVLLSLIVSFYWERFLIYFNSLPFNISEPIFKLDLSFYIFKLPALQIVVLGLQSILIFSIATVTLTYLLANNSISEGKFLGFSRDQLRHLYALIGCLMLVLGVIHWLNRYLLLLSPDGVVYGAGYTDMNINLPREIIASAMGFVIGIWFLFKSFTEKNKNNNYGVKKKNKNFLSFSSIPLTVYALFYGLGILTAFVFQNTIVQPNELELEKPYIVNNIEATRSAFNLDKIEVKIFNPEGSLNAEVLQRNYLTIDNIRLWDTRPILQANRQLQQIRPYYVFYDGDIDRYGIKTSLGKIDNTQVILAPRELDSKLLPSQAQTWVNRHLVYTHGYGFTMSPVNRVGDGGLPYYFIKDIGTEEDPRALNTSSEEIRQSIPIFNPRLYYGEVADNYIMTNTKVPEFDFPSGQDNVYHTYDGEGGIIIASPLQRLIFSVYFRDWRMLLTNNFTPETRILFRRNLMDRISAIAPFLNYDRDPYLVVAKYSPEDENSLYWLIDGYTISNYYPYSDGGENHFNYIRNSVKVLISAEDGKTQFYVSDENDPIIKVWQKVFPQLFHPLTEMPSTLKQHIRYPIDFFNTQSERLLSYHMIDPQVFYNREDQWQVPEEIYGDEALSIQPYYLITKLPIATQEEFILLHPYTPISRSNLIAWLAARSDGENYGKLLLYQFPKQRLVYGPDQVEALINQDPVISGQISLWNRQGAKAVQGNLLIVPIEQSLLYVEPVYLEADRNSVPTLVRVIVVYQNKIVMANSLQNALNGIFAEATQEETPIIRLLQEQQIPLLEPNFNGIE